MSEDRPACYFFRRCQQQASLEKGGRTVCRECANGMKGAEFPLRQPTRIPLYISEREAARALDMPMLWGGGQRV